jgi:nitroreductase
MSETIEGLLRARYGTAPTPPAGPTNDVVRAILDHRSVRAFRPDPLPAGTIETLVAAAQSAPTSSNLQTWSVVAVEDPGRRARLAEFSARQGFIREAPLFLVWCADLSRLGRIGAARGAALTGLDYLEMYMVALIDAALAAQNAVVAAESLGLGTVYVGALRNKPAEVAAELSLPANCMGAFGLSVGWPDPARVTEAKPRLPQSIVLHRETYRPESDEDVERYDSDLAEFSRRNAMAGGGWLERVMSRVGGPQSLSGRDRMREILTRLGFGLR